MKYEGCEDSFSNAGGIPLLVDLFMKSEPYKRLQDCLPARRSNYSYDPIQFALALFAGFLKGYDCLDDLDQLQYDAAVEKKLKEIPSSRTMGEFLRDFSLSQRSELNDVLTEQSLITRQTLTKDEPLVIDLDSTSHVQRGKKIEGLAYNYKGEWCLDSLIAFDDLGLCYGMELRAGNTFSSQGAPQMIRRIFSHVSVMRRKNYFRADSAFCNEEVIHACLEKNLTFTITAHGNTNWEKNVLEKGVVKEWRAWEYSQEEKLASEKTKTPLPRIEIGSFHYTPEWADQLRFQIIVKRTWVDRKEKSLAGGGWKYYAVLTNWNLFYSSPQDVMSFHNKRGNAENFIREGKYGYDLKHFPCKKMGANHAYGLIAQMVHNFIRTIAILDNPSNPHFSKKIRRKYVFIPSRVIKTAGMIRVKIHNRYKKEVDELQHVWAQRFNSALSRVT